MKAFKLLLSVCLFTTIFSHAQEWSFAVISDPRDDKATFTNALREIRDMHINPDKAFKPAEFIIMVGDFDPAKSIYNNYKKVFAETISMKAFFPVKGNHDEGKHTAFITKKILPEQDSITIQNSSYVNYYIDWRNVRIIVVDQYSDFGSDGCINSTGRKWVEESIQSAHHKDHIFICFHEPAFPRIRHLEDSFNEYPEERDAFWNMLIKYKSTVKAVFNGHVHYYYRMRVADPTRKDVLDVNAYPDHTDGIYQINSAACGQGSRNTIVKVQIDGKDISFFVLDADDGGKKSFQILDKWEIRETHE